MKTWVFISPGALLPQTRSSEPQPFRHQEKPSLHDSKICRPEDLLLIQGYMVSRVLSSLLPILCLLLPSTLHWEAKDRQVCPHQRTICRLPPSQGQHGSQTLLLRQKGRNVWVLGGPGSPCNNGTRLSAPCSKPLLSPFFPSSRR